MIRSGQVRYGGRPTSDDAREYVMVIKTPGHWWAWPLDENAEPVPGKLRMSTRDELLACPVRVHPAHRSSTGELAVPDQFHVGP